MQVAIYARVSTERQEREQTIDSQLALLHAWAMEHSHTLEPEHVYTDEGYSGSRLDRPALDRLRDAAREAEFAAVAVLSPDRLARRYAYQVLLVEELRRVGCQLVFLHHPISDDPNDQLLLQIQGAVAEYERAVLGERFRRGRLQRARAGQYLAGGHAPYGYRYVRKHDGLPGHLVIDDAEAEIVQTLYQWLVDERLSLRQIVGRLNFGPWRPRSGSHRWSTSVVHHILSDPIYTGTAYANRYRAVPPKKRRGSHGPRTSERCGHDLRPRDEWIPVPVPRILDEATFARAQEQLARNASLAWRHNTRYRYLLRCLLTCSTCGLAMSGKTYPATATQPERRYYPCNGKDRLLSARERPCPRRPVKADELEAAVWEHLTALLQEPARLLAQFEVAAQAELAGDAREQAERHRVTARLERLARQDARLVDAYQAEVITLAELAERRAHLTEQRRLLAEQHEQWNRLRQQQVRAQETLTSLTQFCERIRTRLARVTFEEQQSILQLLIERIRVGDETLEIRHVIPLGHPPGAAHGDTPPWRLRSDGSRAAERLLR